MSDPLVRFETDAYSEHSSYVERLIEHLFIGELLRAAWAAGEHRIEVLRPEVDASGYDLLLGYGGTFRPVQLKARRLGGRRRDFTIQRALARYPGACVLILNYEPDSFRLMSFDFFGDCTQATGWIPSLDAFPNGVRPTDRAERPGTCAVPQSAFTTLDTIEKLLAALFPAFAQTESLSKISTARSDTAPFASTLDGRRYEVLCRDSYSIWRSHQSDDVHLRMFDGLLSAMKSAPKGVLIARLSVNGDLLSNIVSLRSDIQLSWKGRSAQGSKEKPVLITVELVPNELR